MTSNPSSRSPVTHPTNHQAFLVLLGRFERAASEHALSFAAEKGSTDTAGHARTNAYLAQKDELGCQIKEQVSELFERLAEPDKADACGSDPDLSDADATDPEACSECGCLPGEGYTATCSTCNRFIDTVIRSIH